MSWLNRVCRSCGDEFVLVPNKPGNINDCMNCAVETELPPKNASEVQIEITSNRADATRFNNAQKHHWSKAY
jgi:hypothetical protein